MSGARHLPAALRSVPLPSPRPPLSLAPWPVLTPRPAHTFLTAPPGASNFNEQRVRKAAKFLEGRGTCLSSNQVQYSLIYRAPERNGVMEACRWAGRPGRFRAAAAGSSWGRLCLLVWVKGARRLCRQPGPEPTGTAAPWRRENGVTLVAYSPLCQGLLTGARQGVLMLCTAKQG